MKKYSLIAIKLILALLFFAAGAGKFLGSEFWVQRFIDWGYPGILSYIIGVVELISAILLFIPKFQEKAIYILITLMVGAVFTHLFNSQFYEIIRPVSFLILLSIFVRLRK